MLQLQMAITTQMVAVLAMSSALDAQFGLNSELEASVVRQLGLLEMSRLKGNLRAGC